MICSPSIHTLKLRNCLSSICEPLAAIVRMGPCLRELDISNNPYIFQFQSAGVHHSPIVDGFEYIRASSFHPMCQKYLSGQILIQWPLYSKMRRDSRGALSSDGAAPETLRRDLGMAGVEVLNALGSLTSLNVSFTRAGAAGLLNLTGLTALKQLRALACDISTEHIPALAKTLPFLTLMDLSASW